MMVVRKIKSIMVYYSLRLCVFAVVIFSFKNIFSQPEKKFIREGNKNYKEGKYTEAEESYQKALTKNAESFQGSFNKADALYRQKKFEEAAQQFNSLAQKSNDKNLKAQSYHNLGNSMLQSQKFKESIDAYKSALRNNPEDEDTRKNLAYAMKMLQQQQQQQKNDKDKKDDKKNQQQDKQQQQNDKKEDKKDEKKQQQKQEQNEKEQQAQQQEQKKDQMSKKDAQRLLDAMNNEEKNTQDKLKKEKIIKGQPVVIEKDW